MSRPGEPTAASAPAATDLDLESSLMEEIAAGELAALGTLYDRYRGLAYGLALRITSDAALAEDVVQDVFLGIWRNAARYARTRGSVRTWVLSIVHHRAIDAVRRRRPATSLPGDDEPASGAFTLPDVWPEIAGRLDREAIRVALATLSDVQREALELAYLGGLTQQEIATRTAAPLGTVKSRVRLGLLALRAALTGEESGGNRDASGADPSAATPPGGIP